MKKALTLNVGRSNLSNSCPVFEAALCWKHSLVEACRTLLKNRADFAIII